jgi:hypothetical protein
MLGTKKRLEYFINHRLILLDFLGMFNIVTSRYNIPLIYGGTMKRIFISVILCFFGMTIIAQDMSYYTREYMRSDGDYRSRLIVLEAIRDAGTTGIGEFYHEALKFLLLRDPDISDIPEQTAAEQSAIILCRGLGAERVTAAAPELWHTVEAYSITREGRPAIDPTVMQVALIALGQVDGRDFLPQIVQRLNDFNTQSMTNVEARRRVQTAVIGCISALEALKDISGYRPVFFASIGSYDTTVKQIASAALPNIADDPGEIIASIIIDPSMTPDVKFTAWNEMLKTNAPASSKANVAAVALAIGHTYQSSNLAQISILREMRKSAINAIRQYGVADDSIYANLEKSYNTNFISTQPDMDEIAAVLNALAAIKTEEAVDLLHKFLLELHNRRRGGQWRRDRERQIFEWLNTCIGATGTQSEQVRLLLTTITRASEYTGAEQRMARNALIQLGH